MRLSNALAALSLLLLATAWAPSAAAEPAKCQAAIARASATHAQASLKAMTKCADRVHTGKLAPATNCTAEPKTAATLARAADKLRKLVDRACGGSDRTCGNSDDDTLASVGWDIGGCPDTAEGACAAAIADCGGIADCLTCLGNQAAARLSGLYFDSLGTDPAPRSVQKCQRSMGKAATIYANTRSKATQRCWDQVVKGRAIGPCPTPGDGKATERIAKAESKLIASICRACGGNDRGCDQAVGSTAGTGGSDDLDVATVGFPHSCPDVTIPGTALSCATTVTTVAEMVECVRCTTAARSACVADAAVPFALDLAESCGGPGTDTCGAILYSETFAAADGSAWPAPWTAVGGVETADIQNGQSRLRPTITNYALARLVAALDVADAEATFTVQLDDIDLQGVGFYLRQNGGYVSEVAGAETDPPGAGYAVFVEGGFRGFQSIGVWRELHGHEQPIATPGLPPGTIENGVRYHVRFRVNQASPTHTLLRARLWREGDPEPEFWHVEAFDDTPELQHASGGIAVDSWVDIQPWTEPMPQQEYTFVDDIEVRGLCNPLAGILAPAATIAEGFQFTEGPVWRADDAVLLFTDIPADTIHRLTPPSAIDVLRTPSDEANGLATASNGDLLACEHASRRVTRIDSLGQVSVVADDFGGAAFNSPNDLAVRADGTIYFTDPRYGMVDPVGGGQLGFSGLFRVAPGGAISLEWQGDFWSDGPNGVALSPDQSVLYMSNSETQEVLAWDVAPDGSLSNQRVFVPAHSGLLFIPDGMCVDTQGNLYVAQWGISPAEGRVEVFASDGLHWGSIPIGRQATNCAFGGADGRTLYVTGHDGGGQAGLYATAVPIAGTL